ncbi:MAG TPA: response regulator [Spirochaetota bacterium]|nr:response regulator [Spirochaetota bacterium]HOL57983.1 response regulator [Spirochaetota bacterium]
MKLVCKILVVDDEKLTLDFFDLMLSKLGFEVLKATDGIEALEKIKSHNPDVVLLDNLLPKMTGFEVVQILKKDKDFSQYKDLPIIMFSGMDSPQDKILGLEMGIEDYITKPFNFSEVLARIRNVLRHKELVNQILKREKRLAISETLINNIIAFSRHIKKPLTELLREADKIDCSNKENVVKFIEKFKRDYDEIIALHKSLEEQLYDIENKKNKLKEEELSLEELEKRIAKYLNNKENSEDK